MSEHFFCSSLSKIKSSDWNECVGNDHPFLQYEFLYALEKSNSANTKTGWQPYHYIEQENDKIISLCPLYIRTILLENIFLIILGLMLIIDMG